MITRKLIWIFWSILKNGMCRALLQSEIFTTEKSTREVLLRIAFLSFAGVCISLDTSCTSIASVQTGQVEPIDKWDGDGKYAPCHHTKSKY